jgi:hypothetical protein
VAGGAGKLGSVSVEGEGGGGAGGRKVFTAGSVLGVASGTFPSSSGKLGEFGKFIAKTPKLSKITTTTTKIPFFIMVVTLIILYFKDYDI